MKKMKVLVTGAGGFVGRNLISCLLAHENTVTAIEFAGNHALEAMEHPLLNKVYLQRGETPGHLKAVLDGQEFDTVIHLAWAGAGGPLRADYAVQLNNVKTTLDYFTLAEQLRCKKFVAVGTIGEYMAQLAEKNQIHSENFVYANCKSMAHTLLNIVSYQKQCEVVWATLGGLYGADDSTNNLVNYTVRTLLANQHPTFGPAEQPFDFINIQDCVNALRLIATQPTTSKQFYVGSGAWRPLKEYLLAIEKCVDNGMCVGIGERSDDGTRYLAEWFDISALQQETGYHPQYTFEAGILEIVKRIREE